MTEAIKGAIDALKGSPIILALVLFQFALLALVAWSAHQIREADKERFALVLQSCARTQPNSD
jgi:hypothetical protein